MHDLKKLYHGCSRFDHTGLRRTPENVRRVRAALSRLMRALHAAMEAEGVRYTAVDGTLLGVVRNRDFIPWDDDIDLAVHPDDWDACVARALPRAAAALGVPSRLEAVAKGRGRWYKLHDLTLDLHADVVRADLELDTGLGLINWRDSTEMFAEPLVTYRLRSGEACCGPPEPAAEACLRRCYGPDWRTPQCGDVRARRALYVVVGVLICIILAARHRSYAGTALALVAVLALLWFALTVHARSHPG